MDETHPLFVQLPTLSDTKVSINDSTSVTITSAIKNDGGASIKSSGFCWSKNPNPTINNNKSNDGNGKDSLSHILNNLTPNTTYYVRSYAINKAGTSYGKLISFTTSIEKALVTTTEISNIDITSAGSGGNVSIVSNNTLFEKGVCWSTNHNPTINDNKTSDGINTGSFSSTLSGLLVNTKYYVRAYASCKSGISYGNEVSFNTLDGVMDVDGNAYHIVTIGTQTWMVENLRTAKYRDGSTIPNVTDDPTWIALTSGAWCNYNNDTSYDKKYGKLYNWYTVNDIRNLAPLGWHIASDAEWTTLENYVIANGGNYDGTFTGNKIAKALADSIGWISDTGMGTIGNNLSLNNKFGFRALPAGGHSSNGSFFNFGIIGNWWCSNQYSSTQAWDRGMYSYNSADARGYNVKANGFSVKCIKD